MEKHAVIVWLDSEHAKIFKLAPEKKQMEMVKHHTHEHHTSADAERQKHMDKYFKDVAHHVESIANELLIIGPGQAKSQFKHYLDSHSANLAKQVVGVEASDHPTDAEILAKARSFFKKYDLFH